ncbi:hypothetical protein [Spirilliplanes yamanashiensis]|uniref:Uncharacterized protein n=1 Tax=Spirilliplanes yamanashiensis TaxID=42233 RepID=A0A8J4DFW6_9ACTN|nr:hypothetical protein [Spirilliplanes yamanashiensis]MDP9814048.1 hypothetical protein [Spirilliplanes yamanashiensis]GIJ00972.1 hypothetical protein Sya03_03240 [Spirilliplanes yamanashiensis]
MSRRWRPVLIGSATAGLLAVGGSIAAFASWSTAPAASSLTITAGRVPEMAAPRVALIGRPVVRWDRVRMSADRPVQRYVVTRHADGGSERVCDVPALLATCVDLFAPVGKPVAYSVHATFEEWAGADSGRSGAVTVPKWLAPPSAAVVARVTADATVTPQVLAGPGPATSPAATDPADPAGADPGAGPGAGPGEEVTDPGGDPGTGTPPGTADPGAATPAAAEPGTAEPQTGTPPAQPAEPEVTKPETPATEAGTPGGNGKQDVKRPAR